MQRKAHDALFRPIDDDVLQRAIHEGSLPICAAGGVPA